MIKPKSCEYWDGKNCKKCVGCTEYNSCHLCNDMCKDLMKSPLIICGVKKEDVGTNRA